MPTRFVQGIRLRCRKCGKQVTPTMVFQNNPENITEEIAFACDCGHIITRVKL